MADYEAVDANFTVKMPDLVFYHTFNIIVGAFCFILNLPLLFVFLSNQLLREKYKILIALAFADAINSLSICLSGINRVQMYSKILATHMIPVRTAWECALEPWLFFRGIGDLWAPVIQLCMAIERGFAIFRPVFYYKWLKQKSVWLIYASIAAVVIALGVGFYISFSNKDLKVMYYCGRKAAFSSDYGAFIYIVNIAGYTIGLLINISAFIRASTATSTKNIKKQLVRIRYTLVVSAISCVLVSTPNGISLFSKFFGSVASAISKPSTYLTCINSGINIFIYLIFNQDFRKQVQQMIQVNEVTAVDSTRTFQITKSRGPRTSRNS